MIHLTQTEIDRLKNLFETSVCLLRNLNFHADRMQKMKNKEISQTAQILIENCYAENLVLNNFIFQILDAHERGDFEEIPNIIEGFKECE